MLTYICRLRVHGNSTVISLPPNLLRLVGLRTGDFVTVNATQAGALVLTKIVSPDINPFTQEKRA